MTAPHYGKRNPGGLTAASPGDTLYFNFASYNDSGDSEALTGLAASDIELFKNGNATSRATDSGYSLISDTGQIGDRVGLYRFSVQLFNTADDTGFYDEGSWYQVAVDSVTIDAKTVRAWVGSFEIGEPRANVVEIDGDTGFADRLGKFASLVSSIGQIDTGTISGGFIPSNVRQIAGDTGSAIHLQQLVANGFNDTGVNDRFAKIQADVDTGIRDTITDLDTGLRDHITNVDTGITETIDRILADTDTGIQPPTLAQIVDGVWDELDTGHADTGTYGRLSNRLSKVAADTDTGIQPPTAATVAASVWDGNDTGHGVNVRYVNETEVGGTGSSSDPWGPA